jgi:hypothetical protein
MSSTLEPLIRKERAHHCDIDFEQGGNLVLVGRIDGMDADELKVQILALIYIPLKYLAPVYRDQGPCPENRSPVAVVRQMCGSQSGRSTCPEAVREERAESAAEPVVASAALAE